MHEHAFGILHWTTDNFPVSTPLKKISPSPTSSHYLSIAAQGRGGFQEALPDLRCSIEGLTLGRTYAGTHSGSESVNTMHVLSGLFSGYFSHSLPMALTSFPNPLHNVSWAFDVLLRAEHSPNACVSWTSC